jgi:hypothetical protein
MTGGMKTQIMALLLASLPLGAALAAQPAAAAPATIATAAAGAPRHRLVGVVLSSAQALLWDEEAGEYVLRRVGDDALGGRIVAMEEDHLVVARGEAMEEMPISAPPQRRVSQRRARKQPAVLVSVAPEAAPPSAQATPIAPVPPVAPVQAAPPAPPVPEAPPEAPAMAEVPAPPAPPAPPVAAEVPAAPAAPSAPAAPAAALFTAVNPATLPATLIPRAHLDQELANLGSLGQRVSVTPQAGGGFRLVALQEGSFLHRAGLRAGDVVVRIDARPINRPEDAFQAAVWLKMTDQFTVDLLRDGKPMTLRFLIQ